MTTRSGNLRQHARELVDEEPEAALELYDQALTAEGATLGDLATALKDKAVTLGLLGRNDEALALFGQIIERHHRSDDIEVRAAVDKSLCNKAVLLNEGGRKDEAIRLYDEVANRNMGRPDIKSRRSLAESFLCKASIVQSKGTDEALADAITCYGLVSRTRDKSDDPVLTELAARSLLCETFAFFATHRGFVQSFSWWSRRSLFNRLERAIILLAESPQDSDSSLLLAARAVAMKAHFLDLFGYSKKGDKTRKVETVARQFGTARARRIVAFMEMEQNLRSLAAFSGTQSMGVML
jgi:tetratricopeptide (TPR) repeat protein